MPEQKLVVLGATGNVGSALTAELVDRGATVAAVYLTDPRLPDPPAGVERHPGEFDDERVLEGAMSGASAVFVLTPPHPELPTWHRAVVDAALVCGVTRVVKLSAFDTSPSSLLQMGRWHAEGEAIISDSGLDHAFVRPQYFMQMQRLAMSKAIASGVFEGAPAPDLAMGVVHVADIAAVAAELLLATHPLDGRVVVPTGPEAISWSDMAGTASKVSGDEIRYRQRDRDEILADLRGLGWPDWHVEDYFAIHGDAASSLVTDDVRRIVGRAPRSFTDFVRDEVLEPA